jgi:RimJ/RimL family protein N-acetyltransferase
MRILEATRFTLEPQVPQHAEEMFLVLSDPAIYEYENAPPPSVDWLRTRFERLESRKSPDGTEEWLNWVIRLPTDELIGYVQATVKFGDLAFVAYALSSKFWGRGLASEAVSAMIMELSLSYKVRICFASLKVENFRSILLLERLGFSFANADQCAEHQVESDELLMQVSI